MWGYSMKLKGIAALAPCALALAASLLAGPASATIYNLVYTGVVVAADDPTAEFGAAASLVGKAFTANVTYDDAKVGALNTGGVYYDTYYGYGASNPVTASVLLNGVTRTFGATYGQDSRTDRTLQPNCMFSCTDSDFQQNAEDRYNQGIFSILNYINLGGFSHDGSLSGIAHTAPSFTNPPIDLYAYLSLNTQNAITLEHTVDSYVQVNISSVTGGVRAPVNNGVPEPGAWTLMLMGFGGLGALLRRRRLEIQAAG